MKETKKHVLASDKFRKKYEEEVEFPELERKKEVLRSLRELHSHRDF